MKLNRMKFKQYLCTIRGSSIVTLNVLCLISFSISAAEDANSTNQALQQLRMLQQRLAPATAAPTTAITTSTTTTDSNSGRGTQVATGLPQAPAPQTITQTTQTVTQTTTAANEANPPEISDKEIVDSLAFDGVTQQLFPLTPEQIIRIKQMYNTNEYAKASPAGTPPKPTATSQFVNLSPGSTPPVIRLSQGFVSSLVFLDSTGAPWPISAYDLGDPSSFNIQWDKTSNTLMIQSNKLYNYGNLAVRLRGLNTPVMLTLIPGQKAVDYRVDLRVQGYGPNAKSMPLEEGLPPSASDLLLHVLDGVPPAGSSRLTVSGGDARAWLFNDKMFVRTNLTILSPGWIGSMTSADGMHAYEMQKSPVLLVSWHGKVMQLKVEGL